MTRLHSFEHVNEVGYRAVMRALFPSGFPVRRDALGRYVSRKETKSAQIREELQAKANKPLEDALDTLREAETEAERFARLEPIRFAGMRAPSIAGRG